MSDTEFVFETDSWMGEYDGESEAEWEFTGEGPFDESEEMELAAELLTVVDDAELEQFIGRVFNRARRRVGRAMRGPVGRALGGALRGVARRALPAVGGALGTAVGGPLGGAVGSRVASAAGRAFGLELEGLSPEDQEFEVARSYVRLAGDAAQKAAAAPPDAPPQAVARQALEAAARAHAPGLVGQESEASSGGRSGRWVRRGRNIVLIGV